MQKKIKIFIVYFPVILVACQVLVNLLYFAWPSAYNNTGFYLNLFFGSNIMVGVFLLVVTFGLKFCAISRWASVAELLYGVNYLIVQQDNTYNIVFQIITGAVALIITFRAYLSNFPLCQMSLFFSFLGSIFSSKGDCEKAIDHWQDKLNSTIEKQTANGRNI